MSSWFLDSELLTCLYLYICNQIYDILEINKNLKIRDQKSKETSS